ncbi:hypothetical protein CKA32_002645 [Geitlerinema sp. FC II]|nr:hypothetical protein CKA32_002645 [Geitlerinema sp. FC II]
MWGRSMLPLFGTVPPRVVTEGDIGSRAIGLLSRTDRDRG